MLDIDSMELLNNLCTEHLGEHYESSEWIKAADEHDWTSVWPIVDGDGLLTGEIYESGDDSDDYANAGGNMVMVLIDDLPENVQAEIRTQKQNDCWDGEGWGLTESDPT